MKEEMCRGVRISSKCLILASETVVPIWDAERKQFEKDLWEMLPRMQKILNPDSLVLRLYSRGYISEWSKQTIEHIPQRESKVTELWMVLKQNSGNFHDIEKLLSLMDVERCVISDNISENPDFENLLEELSFMQKKAIRDKFRQRRVIPNNTVTLVKLEDIRVPPILHIHSKHLKSESGQELVDVVLQTETTLPFVVIGGRGSGKTTEAHNLALRLTNFPKIQVLFASAKELVGDKSLLEDCLSQQNGFGPDFPNKKQAYRSELEKALSKTTCDVRITIDDFSWDTCKSSTLKDILRGGNISLPFFQVIVFTTPMELVEIKSDAYLVELKGIPECQAENFCMAHIAALQEDPEVFRVKYRSLSCLVDFHGELSNPLFLVTLVRKWKSRLPRILDAFARHLADLDNQDTKVFDTAFSAQKKRKNSEESPYQTMSQRIVANAKKMAYNGMVLTGRAKIEEADHKLKDIFLRSGILIKKLRGKENTFQISEAQFRSDLIKVHFAIAHAFEGNYAESKLLEFVKRFCGRATPLKFTTVTLLLHHLSQSIKRGNLLPTVVQHLLTEVKTLLQSDEVEEKVSRLQYFQESLNWHTYAPKLREAFDIPTLFDYVCVLTGIQVKMISCDKRMCLYVDGSKRKTEPQASLQEIQKLVKLNPFDKFIYSGSGGEEFAQGIKLLTESVSKFSNIRIPEVILRIASSSTTTVSTVSQPFSRGNKLRDSLRNFQRRYSRKLSTVSAENDPKIHIVDLMVSLEGDGIISGNILGFLQTVSVDRLRLRNLSPSAIKQILENISARHLFSIEISSAQGFALCHNDMWRSIIDALPCDLWQFSFTASDAISEGIVKLVEHCAITCKQISLDGNPIINTASSRLGSIFGNAKELETLSLQRCGLNYELVLSIWKELKHSKTISQISLSGNDINTREWSNIESEFRNQNPSWRQVEGTLFLPDKK